MVRRNVHVAYSLSLKGGLLYHARAYMSEDGNPGLPKDYTFRSATFSANDERSADAACRWAVARLLRDYPEAADSPVFKYGRLSEELVQAACVLGYSGKGYGVGVASAYAES